MVKSHPSYKDALTYPIFIKHEDGKKEIVEMSGKEMNDWLWKCYQEKDKNTLRWFI
jgi:hypothetical protein